MKEAGENKGIVLFDGYCNFCSSSIRFIIPRDRNKSFRFAAAQTETGEQLQSRYQLGALASHSIVLIRNERVYSKSRAALEIARKLKGLWPVFYVLILLPPFFRDFFYDLIAKNRYRLLGKRDSCYLPSEDEGERFL